MSELTEHFPQLAVLAAEELELLAAALDIQQYPAGHVFVTEGELPTELNSALFFILHGEVEVVRREVVGRQRVLGTLGPGEVFGLVALLDNGVRSATCRAARGVRAGRLDRADLDRLVDAESLYAHLQLLMARQLVLDIRNLCGLLGEALITDDHLSIRKAFAGG